MARRQVTRTRKDSDRDILALCNGSEPWSPRAKADAINDIDLKIHSYYVTHQDRTVDVHVARAATGARYLRTDWDSTTHNNLDDLPDC